ncbi:hypothetical protein LTR24_006212 [Lithohypha guttulata]|uniref:HORMA domain-containing protein n=1 Tax=Lithohypha guttulata TaxID=1690604 RepID=A0ABR0K825_9EURO|nr:hypothetical protein LTR24_006212 [Lithohypha guttulata]
MANVPPNTSAASNILTTQRALVDTICSLLTVVTHHVLYLRRLYPPVSFLATRAYNYPVRQNRHPEVCTWINDALTAVRDQIEKNTVETVAICIFECDNYEVLERWSFDLRSLPVVAKKDRDIPFDSIDDVELRKKVNVTDLEASFRALFSRLDTVSGKMRPLPEGDGAPECSFTMTVEVKDGADRPVGRLQKEERKWVVAEPDLFDDEDSNGEARGDSNTFTGRTGKTHAIRRLEAGELRMEMFVEESDTKLKLPTKYKTTLQRAAEMSYGAGSEKFDPQNGYELEEPDVNRKPQGGAFTDYQRG